MSSITTIPKGWGEEVVWANTNTYCGKFLNFKEGAKFSMHFHKNKDETWYIVSGKFMLTYIHTPTAERKQLELNVGDSWRNEPLEPHQLHCLESGTVFEVSTHDDPNDNYRILPGDSQTWHIQKK